MDTLRQSCGMGQTTDDQLEAQHHQKFYNWYTDYVRII